MDQKTVGLPAPKRLQWRHGSWSPQRCPWRDPAPKYWSARANHVHQFDPPVEDKQKDLWFWGQAYLDGIWERAVQSDTSEKAWWFKDSSKFLRWAGGQNLPSLTPGLNYLNRERVGRFWDSFGLDAGVHRMPHGERFRTSSQSVS